jgi:hypothetical protein
MLPGFTNTFKMTTQKEHNLRVIGRREYVDFPLLNIAHTEAKIDTGAFSSAIHCENIEVKQENGTPVLTFTLPEEFYPGNKTTVKRFTEFKQKKIKNSFGEAEDRYIIRTKIHIGHKTIMADFSLSDRKSMRYPILIGRKAIKGKFIIDVKQVHLKGLKLSVYLNQLSNT